MRPAALAAILILAAFARGNGAPTPSPSEVRALWVVRTTLATPESVVAMVDAARQSGFNTLLVQVRGRGDAYYRSRVEPPARVLSGQSEDFDPLALVVSRAKASGLAVHAWVNVNLVADASDLPASDRHVVRRHPEWLMVPRELARDLQRIPPRSPAYLARLASWTRAQSASVEGLYVSPIHDGAADYVDEVVRDLVSRYPLDGLHLDYVRYPGPAFDYSRGSLEAFKHEMDRRVSKGERKDLAQALKADVLAYTERFPADWQAFRRTRLDAVLRRLRATVKSVRPDALLSAAVVPDEATAAGGRGQDWPGWLREGLLDVVCPMVYTTEASVFESQVVRARTLAARAQLWAGIGAYRLSPEQTVGHIDAARDAGADGVVLFSYDSLVHPPRGPDYLARLADAAFAR